jgi:hypothetical protein
MVKSVHVQAWYRGRRFGVTLDVYQLAAMAAKLAVALVAKYFQYVEVIVV